MPGFNLEFNGLSVDVNADREGVELDRARIVDAVALMRWACEGATDEQLNLMAAELVKEQRARDEAAQRLQDEQEAQAHAGGAA